MSDIETIASLTGNNTSSASQSRVSFGDDFDDFLTLLTTQLQNQDPLEPTDTTEFTNQLVLFAGVEQNIEQNGNLESLIALQTQNQAVGALGYIGQDVEAEGNIFTIEEGETPTLSYELDDTAANAAITISNAAGDVVFVGAVDTEFGEHNFVWDGVGANGASVPAGAYTFQINAVNADQQAVGVKTSTRNRVDGVESGDDGTFLTSGILSIPLDRVFAAFAPPPVQAPDVGT